MCDPLYIDAFRGKIIAKFFKKISLFRIFAIVNCSPKWSVSPGDLKFTKEISLRKTRIFFVKFGF